MIGELVARVFDEPFEWLQMWRRTMLARRLVRQLNLADDLVAKVAFTSGHSKFKSNQKTSEIVALLGEVERLRPRILCEIGSDRGGTLALLAQVASDDALIVSIDPIHQHRNTIPYESLVRGSQRLIRIGGDSHASEVIGHLKTVLAGHTLDFLLIDGDHSYSGVKQDFEMYAPLVRKDGLIAFHDIVPIQSEASQAYVGGVPDYFTQEIAPTYETRTWIDSATQDGYGIGTLVWPGERVATNQAMDAWVARSA
ncbi:class I SAM-dependent methyltransferase [Bremerella cremea]|uniref:Class I SAM-dependent methyltransferase n=2 Tax=Pirellulales TaxID=2691354 RepID=A0A2S8FCZ8_9BACT|nr:hypothetical protein C5Y83_27615 [Blastopirellula marina]RCS43116.1 class I SAM-dependent methyltransferase [Bremerella cremea]